MKRVRAGTIARVANQQREALRKQQRGVWGRPRAVLLAHHPGHAVVRPPAARRLSPWQGSRQPRECLQPGGVVRRHTEQ